MVRSFLGQRIQLIKERDHSAYQYEGKEDATRGAPEQWTKEAMVERLKTLFQNDADVDSAPLLAGFHVNNPPDEVHESSSNLMSSGFPSESHSALCLVLILIRS